MPALRYPPATVRVVVTGGTGYLGVPLVESLVARGHRVRVLCRAAAVRRVPAGAEVVVGDALDPDDVAAALPEGATLVHLVGTPHPGPAKVAEFERVDLASIRASVQAASQRRVPHLVYVSVAHPAPVMHAYVAARIAGERAIAATSIAATILRPWYVLGPGHRWPLVLVPLARLLEVLPWTRESARRLGFVTLDRMVTALVGAVESPPPPGTRRVLDVAAIRAAAARPRSS